MNKQEYLLNKLSQECIEVAKEISKALEFGLEDVYESKTHKSNKQRIESELNDLMGVLQLMVKVNMLDNLAIFNPVGILEKVKKINKYMKYSRKTGALE